MDNPNFVLPSVGTTGMSIGDQKRLLVTQASALVVAAYLTHMNAAMAAGIQTGGSNPNNFLSPAELTQLIDAVETAFS